MGPRRCFGRRHFCTSPNIESGSERLQVMSLALGLLAKLGRVYVKSRDLLHVELRRVGAMGRRLLIMCARGRIVVAV
jgi:hypothetical protein